MLEVQITLSLQKHLFEVNPNNLETFLYNLIHNALNQILIFCLFTSVDTLLVVKTWFDSFLFWIQIHVNDKLKWINIFIVLKKMFIIWYDLFLLTLITSTWIIFWYDDWKVGLACPKNDVEKLYYFECLSQNIPRDQKPSLEASDNDFELLSIICSRSNMFWIKMSPKLPSIIF